MNDSDLAQARRDFAESLRTSCGLESDRLIHALATVPRERFLGPGPWLIRAAGDFAGPRRTESDDPRLVYANVSVAIDPARDLYNGQPGLAAQWIDALDVRTNDRILHIGCGTGYYTALLAEITGPAGRVTAIEIDPDLAARAAENLVDWPHSNVVVGNGRDDLPSPVDVLVVQAGATHVLDEWLDVVRDGGRALVPLSCTSPEMSPNLGKGLVLFLRRAGADWHVTVGSFLMIYSLIDVRDETMNERLGRALFQVTAPVTRLRRDPHEPGPACWLHGSTTCLSG